MHSQREIEEWLAETLLPRLAVEKRAAYALRDRRLAAQLTTRTKLVMIFAGMLTALWLRSFDGLLVAFAVPFAVDLLRRSRIGHHSCDVRAEYLAPIIEFLDPSFEYSPIAQISRAELEATGLFTERFDRSRSADRVSGIVGKTAFRCTEIGLTRSSSPRQPSERVFTGILLEADAPREFQGSVYVLPARSEAPRSAFERSAQPFGRPRVGLQPVPLEDPGFEERFQVFASDQAEARSLVTPALRQRLLQLGDHYGADARAVFRDGQLYLALDLSRDFFPTPGGVLGLDVELCRDWIHDVLTIAGLVEALDPTRAWSKSG